jgi:acylphosphatase
VSRTAVHVVIEGRVQGVGFRAFVEREARAKRLAGWVRNRSDGSVEAVFSGEPQLVRAMVEACHRGPRLAAVAAVKTSIYPDQDWTDFAVWPTE